MEDHRIAEVQPLLAINIPIYNRGSYLERMLARFLEDKDLFEEKISLYVSDNASDDPLEEIVRKYRAAGLRVAYDRNPENIGGDRNIRKCFLRSGGKYVWVLGSDDIPRPGVVRTILSILESGTYGLLHLNHYGRKSGVEVFTSADAFFATAHVWLTFITGNIVNSGYIGQVDITPYLETSLQQVPLFLAAGYGEERNAMLCQEYLEDGADSINNGGYNLFQVFCDNYLRLMHSAVESGKMTGPVYRNIKKTLFKEFLSYYVFTLLILRKQKNFDRKGAWRILARHYGGCLYSYWYVACQIWKGALVSLRLRLKH